MAPSKLERQLKKKRPFSSKEQEAALNLFRTSDRLNGRFGRLFKKHGITGSQYNVLRILRGEGGPLPSLEIAQRMIQAVPAITGLVDRLEQQNLVRRQRCSDDRRVVRVALTAKAQRLLDDLDPSVKDLHKELLGHLTSAELGELTRLLEKARERCGG